MDLRERSRRKRIADVLAVGAPIAVGLSIATMSLRLILEGQSHVECGTIRDFVVGFLAGAFLSWGESHLEPQALSCALG
jgi:fructose-specific phosphotransferase system IIC component